MLQGLFTSNNDPEDPLAPNVHTRLAGDENEANLGSEQGMWSRFRSFVSTSEVETSGTNDPFFPALSYQTRLLGFMSCFIAGFVLSFFSSFTLMTGNIKRFAFIYTVGNLVAMSGTGFLIGPKRQMESALDDRRKLSFGVYIGSMLLTIVFALMGKGILIVFPLFIAQWCAGIWYTASYIPYGRDAVRGFVNSTTGLNL